MSQYMPILDLIDIELTRIEQTKRTLLALKRMVLQLLGAPDQYTSKIFDESVKDFVKHITQQMPMQKVRGNVLYQEYLSWCNSNYCKPIGKKLFFKELEDLNLKVIIDRNKLKWFWIPNPKSENLGEDNNA